MCLMHSTSFSPPPQPTKGGVFEVEVKFLATPLRGLGPTIPSLALQPVCSFVRGI
jgi:hypothetical protein